jgi:cell division protein FtsB
MYFLQAPATTNFLSSFSSDFLVALLSSATTLVTGYMLLRERLLKTEYKLETVYDYIDNRNTIIENKIKDLQQDIQDFKDLNKDTSKSLAENTAAINELKIVLSIVTEKLTATK